MSSSESAGDIALYHYHAKTREVNKLDCQIVVICCKPNSLVFDY